MKIAELQKRENYDAELQHTIDSIIRIDREFYGDDIDDSKTIQWYCHPVFSVYVSKQFCKTGRQFLSNLYRYSPDRIKRYIQPVITTILSNAFVFEKSLKPAFVTPDLTDSDNVMWMPGNCRFRKFDFLKRTVRIYPKSGFSDESIHRELCFRTKIDGANFAHDWLLPIHKYDDSANAVKTFEEPIIDAIPINRIPGYRNNDDYIRAIEKILEQLHQFEEYENIGQGKAQKSMTASDYITWKQNQFHYYSDVLHERFPGISLANVTLRMSKAFDVVSSAKTIETAWTHGDFQPGNILISQNRQSDIFIADWEDVGIRAGIYDAMTYNLESRTRPDVYKRLQLFADDPSSFPMKVDCSPTLAAALWEIEEWIWLLESSARKGIIQIPLGLCRRFREIADIIRA